MPALLLLAVGGFGGFILGNGTEGAGNLIKWVIVGGGVLVTAKALKWI